MKHTLVCMQLDLPQIEARLAVRLEARRIVHVLLEEGHEQLPSRLAVAASEEGESERELHALHLHTTTVGSNRTHAAASDRWSTPPPLRCL